MLGYAPVPKVLMPMWPVCACGLPIMGKCAQAWNFGLVTFDLGAMTMTLCDTGGDGSICCGTATDLVIFLDLG